MTIKKYSKKVLEKNVGELDQLAQISHLCVDPNPFVCLIYRKTRFLETDLGIAPQPAQDLDRPLVWPQGYSHKMPKCLSKNILKKLKTKIGGKVPSGSTFAGDETH